MSGVPPTTPNNIPKPSGNSGQVVQVVSLPEGLQNVSRAMRVEGEVVQQNSDGTTRIKTPEGNIDVSIRGRQPQSGTKVEVDIPTGHPPRQVTVRPAPTQSAPQPQPTAPPPTQTTTPAPQPNVPLPQTPPATSQPTQPPQTGNTQTPKPQTPVTTQPALPDISTGTTKPQTTVSGQPPVQTTKPGVLPTNLPPLNVGQTIQLIAAPALDSPDNILQTIVDKTTTQTTLTAQKTQGNLVTTLLQAVKSVLPASVTAPLQLQIKNPANIVTSNTTQTIQTQPIVTQPLVLSAKILALIPPIAQNPLTQQTPLSATMYVTTPAPPQQSAIQPVQPFTVTIAAPTPQNMPIVPIVMNADTGEVRNFVIQASAVNTPAGTQITLQPQLNLQTIQTPTIQTPTMMASLASPETVPTLTPTITQAAATLPPAWRPLLPFMQASSLWPVMDEVFQSFYQATPQAAQILGRIIPSPANAANFGPAALLFIAAIRSGDIQAWFGDKKLEMIQKLGKDSLLSRLSGETSSLQNVDAPPTEWKSFPVPMLWQNEISKIMLHVREEPQEENRENKDGCTRFVLDLALTRMGDVQLDGIVRGKQLDLIVRTQFPISAPMQDAMRTSYAQALDGTDIFGDIGFQSDVKAWRVIKQDEMLAVSV